MAGRFEDTTFAQVQAQAASEEAVRRGKPLYADRTWTQLRDEMYDQQARNVGDLPRSRRRALHAAIKAQSAE